MEIASGTVLRLADDASVQHVGDGAVVLLARSGQLYTCNGTTEAFLDKVDGARSLSQIVGLLCEEFEIDKGTLDEDMAALATELVSEGILAAPGLDG
ncbi:PqqD family protein [Mesorhizobium sp. B2-3-12]|uniref:PqqD family protein n=1 Tax=Mesorhizobium sp. B2-3-12 TaxID=2589952 RepID=UPI0011296706|nr:PqqD family protein [Mesorhizobium sp. B2-3-12]TPL84289.1 PqqD family protein [Mesorhizobium sp. B2-3-12]